MDDKHNIQICCSQCTMKLDVTWHWIKKKRKDLLQQRYLTLYVGVMPSFPLLRFLNHSRHNIPPFQFLEIEQPAEGSWLSVWVSMQQIGRTLLFKMECCSHCGMQNPLDSNNPGTAKLSWRTQHISHKVWTSCAIHRYHEEYNEMWLFQ